MSSPDFHHLGLYPNSLKCAACSVPTVAWDVLFCSMNLKLYN